MLLAEGMTIGDWLQANTTLLSAAIATLFATVVAGVGWYFSEVWKSRNAREEKLSIQQLEITERKAKKEETLLDVLSEHFPKQTETLSTMRECLVESRKLDSDFIKVLSNITEGIDAMAVAVVAGACPDRAEIAKAHLHEHIERAERRKREMGAK